MRTFLVGFFDHVYVVAYFGRLVDRNVEGTSVASSIVFLEGIHGNLLVPKYIMANLSYWKDGDS